MSSREHWPNVVSSVVDGDAITFCRDNDTKSYRLFVHKGFRYVDVGHHKGKAYQMESCLCADLSVENLKALSETLQRVVEAHQPWPEYD